MQTMIKFLYYKCPGHGVGSRTLAHDRNGQCLSKNEEDCLIFIHKTYPYPLCLVTPPYPIDC